MSIPDVSREALEEAMERFDRDLAGTPKYVSWQDKLTHRYAIERDGKLYPVKQIVSLATGLSVRGFYGGEEANNYVKARGLSVIRLRETGLKALFEKILRDYETTRKSTPFNHNNEVFKTFQAEMRTKSWTTLEGSSCICTRIGFEPCGSTSGWASESA